MSRWLSIGIGIVILVTIVLALAAPIGPMPGIRIGGTPASVPAQWPTRLPDEVLFATHDGALPHVVIIWVVTANNRLYVIGAPDSTWVDEATASPNVEVRIGDAVYGMLATRLEPGREDIFQLYVDRYKDDYPDIVASFPPLPEFAQGGAAFELVAR